MTNPATVTSPLPAEQLAARAAVYQGLSGLGAGPHLGEAGIDYWLQNTALLQAGVRALPFAWDADALIRRLQSLDQDQQAALAVDYSAFFEAGSGGMRFPIREDIARNTGSMKQKEELVRYYEFFGYALNEAVQWQPDHLAVELEFMSFLIEAQWSQSTDEKQLSFMLGQRDFLQRHLLVWLPLLQEPLLDQAGEHFYSDAILATLAFIQQDYHWLQAALAPLEEV